MDELYPYLVIFDPIFGNSRVPVIFVSSEVQLPEPDAFALLWRQPTIDAMGNLTAECREALVAAVRSQVRRTGNNICLVFSRTEYDRIDAPDGLVWHYREPSFFDLSDEEIEAGSGTRPAKSDSWRPRSANARPKVIKTWRQAIKRMRGRYLRDQEPEKTGYALSIEQLSENCWAVHRCKKGEDGMFTFEEMGTGLTAELTYRELFLQGRRRELNYDDEKAVNLPDKRDLFLEVALRLLPGRYLGYKEKIEEGQASEKIYYSAEYQRQNRQYRICMIREPSCSWDWAFLDEPRLEEVARCQEHQLVEKIRKLGLTYEAGMIESRSIN